MIRNLKKLIPMPLMRAYHFALQWIFWRWYRKKIEDLAIIGVTGTKGKTTVVEMTKHLLDVAGITAASISSLSFQIGVDKEENRTGNSLRGRGLAIRFLKKAWQKGATHAVLEVTSEGIAQSRHRFLPYHGAVFLGIHPEHLERHGGFDQYLEAKLDLFRELTKSKRQNKFAVINTDDPYAERFAKEAQGVRIFGFGLKQVELPCETCVAPEKYSITMRGISLILDGRVVSSSLFGEGNVKNILAVVAIGRALSIEPEKIYQAIETFEPIAGRFEILRAPNKGKKIKVVIDYAHTPDSIEMLYKDIWKIFKPQRLLALIGIDGGGRDKWKRAAIGELTGKYCQCAVISNVNPYDEDSCTIAKEIEVGVLKYFREVGAQKPYEIILDRTAAINYLVAYAKDGDIIVSIAKGSEPYIVVRGEKLAWNEREEFEKALRGAQ